MSQKQDQTNSSDNQKVLDKYTKAAQIEQILAGLSKTQKRDILDLVLSQNGYRSIPFGVPTFNPIEGINRKIKDDPETSISKEPKGKTKSLYKDDPEYQEILSEEQDLIKRIKSKKKELKLDKGQTSEDAEILEFKKSLDAVHLRKKNRKDAICKAKGIDRSKLAKGKGSST